MQVMILDQNSKNVKELTDFIKNNYKWNVRSYSTIFSLVTAVYDEYKGDVELILIHIADDGECIEAAADLQAFYPHIRLIFYSANTSFAETIFLTVPSFFLKTPFKAEWLQKAFERVKVENDEDVGNTIKIQCKGHKQKIRYSSIRYIENMRRKLMLYTDGGMFETYMTFADVLKDLPQQFIQCHRSYIVNTDRINEYSSEGIVLFSKEFVPVSRSFQNQIKTILNHEG